MGIGVGIVLLVLGLILALRVIDFGVVENYVETGTLGWILIICGVLAIVLALVLNAQRSRTQTTYVERRGSRRDYRDY